MHRQKGRTSQCVFYFHPLTLWAEIKGEHDNLNSFKYCNFLQASPAYHSLNIYCYLHLNAIISLYSKAIFCSPEMCELQHVVLREQWAIWDCKSGAPTRTLQNFNAQHCLERGRTKLLVNLSLPCKNISLTLMVLSGGGFTPNKKKWYTMLPRKTSPSQTIVPSKWLSAQNDMFRGFYWVLWQSGAIISLSARFNLGTWCNYKIFQTVSPVMQHEGYCQAGFLSLVPNYP